MIKISGTKVSRCRTTFIYCTKRELIFGSKKNCKEIPDLAVKRNERNLIQLRVPNWLGGNKCI